MSDFDAVKRKVAYTYMADRVNTMNYILPVSSLPTSYAMTKDVKILPDSVYYSGVYLNDLVWDDYQSK